MKRNTTPILAGIALLVALVVVGTAIVLNTRPNAEPIASTPNPSRPASQTPGQVALPVTAAVDHDDDTVPMDHLPLNLQAPARAIHVTAFKRHEDHDAQHDAEDNLNNSLALFDHWAPLLAQTAEANTTASNARAERPTGNSTPDHPPHQVATPDPNSADHPSPEYIDEVAFFEIPIQKSIRRQAATGNGENANDNNDEASTSPTSPDTPDNPDGDYFNRLAADVIEHYRGQLDPNAWLLAKPVVKEQDGRMTAIYLPRTAAGGDRMLIVDVVANKPGPPGAGEDKPEALSGTLWLRYTVDADAGN